MHSFKNHREACLAVLNSSTELTRKAGQFLGGESCTEGPLSPAQLKWLNQLLVKAGLPTMETNNA